MALLGAWGATTVRFAVTGDLPENVMPPSAVHLVYALDMGVLAPVFVLAGTLLWRRAPWGAVLAVAVNASGAAYLAVLWAVGGFQAGAGIPGTSWLSPVAIGSVAACLLATLALLVHPHPDADGPRHPPRAGARSGSDASAAPTPRGPRRRRRRASRAGCRPSTSRASAPAPEIHIAGTRRSPRREPESMKQRFFSSTCGACVTTRDALLDGERGAPAAEDDRQRLLGAHAEELLAPVDVEQEVGAGVGQRDLLDRAVGRQALLAVVAVDDARAACPGARAGAAGRSARGSTTSRVTTSTRAARPGGSSSGRSGSVAAVSHSGASRSVNAVSVSPARAG